jgi:hypothetical protein
MVKLIKKMKYSICTDQPVRINFLNFEKNLVETNTCAK